MGIFESLDIITVVKFFVAVVTIINPLGSIPIFLYLTRSFSQEEIQKIATNSGITIFITLTLAIFLGQSILGFFGISIVSFRVAGGFLIGLMALNMLKAEQSSVKISQDEIERQNQIKELGIVPIAIPMLAGPGAISTSIIHSEKFTEFTHWVGAIVVLALTCTITWLTLTYSRKIREKMGRIGLNVMTRVMGLILLSVAVETIYYGLKTMFPVLLYHP